MAPNSQRYALVRQSNGRYKKVKVGDKIDGGTVKAITATEVRYQKGGKLVVADDAEGLTAGCPRWTDPA